MIVDDLLLAVGDVLGPDVHLREPVGILDLIPEGMLVRLLDLLRERGMELHLPPLRPVVVDEIIVHVCYLDAEVLSVLYGPLDAERVIPSRLR